MNKCEQYCQTIQRMSGERAPISNTVLLLPFNGDVTDHSGNNYAVTIHGTPVYEEGYFSGTTAYKTSDDNYVEYLTIPTLEGTFSVDFFGKGLNAGRYIKNGSFNYSINNTQYGGLSVTAYDSDLGTLPIIAQGLNFGQWYHIAVTRDDTNTVRLFVDGVYRGSTVNTSIAGSRVSIDSGYVYNASRFLYISNYRLTTDVLHEVNSGVYTFPVPTGLYTG